MIVRNKIYSFGHDAVKEKELTLNQFMKYEGEQKMLVENTKEARIIKSVAATMAIEDMYFDRDFIKEMLLVSKGERTTEEVIEEIIQKYGR